jgi:hypothetical protein
MHLVDGGIDRYKRIGNLRVCAIYAVGLKTEKRNIHAGYYKPRWSAARRRARRRVRCNDRRANYCVR